MNPARSIVRLALSFALAAFVLPTAHAVSFPGLDKLNNLKKKVEDTTRKTQDTAGKAGRVVKGIAGISLEEEVAIGDAVALEILGKYGGLWRDEEATGRVNLIGRALGRFAVRQDLVWRFGLLNSDAINAFSAPGGRVFITRGLYRMLGSDHELAGVLAHEIVHIDRRHALRIIARGELLGGVTDLVADNNTDFALYEQVVSDVTKSILETGYDSNSEFDADKRARELARTTGYAPGGLRVVIEALRKHDTTQKDKSFSTHPAAADRLRRLPNDPPPPASGS